MLHDQVRQRLEGKEYIYLVHVPNTGGMYIKKTGFKFEHRFQWFGKNLRQFNGIKSDDHPCGLKSPIILRHSAYL